ncbi:MAG TPA: hypothetical protein PL045_03680 [Chitinophagaceae bacterium]|nr:hypothetical protein [Chitinophagaceae bacterium]
MDDIVTEIKKGIDEFEMTGETTKLSVATTLFSIKLIVKKGDAAEQFSEAMKKFKKFDAMQRLFTPSHQ